jgi:hypothetical protein
MNIQEREEMEFGDGYPNESARLHAWEKITEWAGVKINKNHTAWLSSLGFYSVICRYPVYGSNTDAFLGYNESLDLVTRCSAQVEDFIKTEDYEIAYRVVYPEAV